MPEQGDDRTFLRRRMRTCLSGMRYARLSLWLVDKQGNMGANEQLFIICPRNDRVVGVLLKDPFSLLSQSCVQYFLLPMDLEQLSASDRSNIVGKLDQRWQHGVENRNRRIR